MSIEQPPSGQSQPHNPLRAALERFGRERRGQPQQEPAKHEYRDGPLFTQCAYCGQPHYNEIHNTKPKKQERQAGGHHVHTRMLPGDRHYGHCVVLLEGGDLCGFEAPEQWWQGWEARGKADAANDRNWAERIEIAKAAREGGRILREGQE